ncbi:TIGR03364 family FAD-dependent oxidoreductase [Hyphomicrobium sp. CS1BSMeth3]|uniref:TIGR03364 family FAD-dependent oxidoreductase n=1 Tax=Hyphomicrobium sp. CS1BSMeth3 TaxID=1892844 RepID=UPI000930F06D|nr:TIGR03364 family FAD-dependent oxidoreductase [Hyphomicrobium sp. CS1BSMeth3]
MSTRVFDLAVIGAGIVGLAHALAAARRGLRVVVIDRDAAANGASIRNFGFVTVTGQQAGACWSRAMRSRDVWAEVAPEAGIRVEHAGLCAVARRPEARRVLEAFLSTEMGRACRLLEPREAAEKVPLLKRDAIAAALWSPHELRVESREAVPRLAAWLEAARGVTFLRSALVKDVAVPVITTTRGPVHAGCVVVCPGHDFLSLFPERIAAYGLTTCKLQMLRVMPANPSARLGTAVMSDLGFVRYLGYAELPEAEALKQRLRAEQAAHLAHGVHLIAVQSADGSLVVGDSHHYGETLDPFAATSIDDLILDELDAVLDLPGRTVSARWTGVYASAGDRLMLVDSPSDGVRIVIVTSGTGASTAFAIGEEVISELFGSTTGGVSA